MKSVLGLLVCLSRLQSKRVFECVAGFQGEV
jgi:hypothetical protein